MNVYVVECEYHPVVGNTVGVPNDKVHVIAPNSNDAMKEAMRHINERPLYPLSTFTPCNFRIVSCNPCLNSED